MCCPVCYAYPYITNRLPQQDNALQAVGPLAKGRLLAAHGMVVGMGMSSMAVVSS
jgi:hypothetical protein